MPFFRKIDPIESTRRDFYWYHNGVYLAPDRGDLLAPMGWEPVREPSIRSLQIASRVFVDLDMRAVVMDVKAVEAIAAIIDKVLEKQAKERSA